MGSAVVTPWCLKGREFMQFDIFTESFIILIILTLFCFFSTLFFMIMLPNYQSTMFYTVGSGSLILFSITNYEVMLRILQSALHSVNFGLFLPRRIALFAYYIVIILFCAFYISMRNSASLKKASTRERKIFHVLILMVYIPGIVYDIQLLFASSVLLFCIFLVLSLIEAFQIPPVGKYLRGFLQQFTDKQDQGKLIVTPTYLLLGISMPIWVTCCKHQYLLDLDALWTPPPLAIYSGLLSVGIGDAFASYFGSKYGRHIIKGTGKTVEGTLACAISIFISVLVLTYLNLCAVDQSYLFILLYSFLISLIEATTSEIDNLVLPLFTYFLFL